MSDDRLVTLAVTMGDPRGIGPEVLVKALAGGRLPEEARIVVVGSRAVIEAQAAQLGAKLDLPPFAPTRKSRSDHELLDVGEFRAERMQPHVASADAGRASADYIEAALRLVPDGEADAVVTCPINKQSMAMAGVPFPGHTEMLAHLTGGARPVMLMACPDLRVALVTTHLALRDVPGAVTRDGIVEVATILDAALRRYFASSRPRIAVCGLNPHCSDGGRFGDEEARIVGPAVKDLQAHGIDVTGPMPSDTVFGAAVRGDFDAVVALYHDQALIPVKLAGLGRVVNITLGLPIIRTSVGHGTAYDIAGQGIADEASLLEAIGCATRMVASSRETDRTA